MSARDNYKQARRELEAIARRSKDETPEYRAANAKVDKAAKELPWWKR